MNGARTYVAPVALQVESGVLAAASAARPARSTMN